MKQCDEFNEDGQHYKVVTITQEDKKNKETQRNKDYDENEESDETKEYDENKDDNKEYGDKKEAQSKKDDGGLDEVQDTEQDIDPWRLILISKERPDYIQYYQNLDDNDEAITF